MKTYQTPQVQLQFLSDSDVIATSSPNPNNGYFIDGQGKQDGGVLDWWG